MVVNDKYLLGHFQHFRCAQDRPLLVGEREEIGKTMRCLRFLSRLKHLPERHAPNTHCCGLRTENSSQAIIGTLHTRCNPTKITFSYGTLFPGSSLCALSIRGTTYQSNAYIRASSR